MSKRIFSLLFLTVVLTSVFFASSVLAQENYKAKLHFFYGSTCYFCKQAESFLTGLESKYPDLMVVSYEVFEHPENARLFKRFLEAAGQEPVIKVPVIFIGEKTIFGFGGETTTGREIEEAVKFCLANDCSDLSDKIAPEQTKSYKLPLLGEFDPKTISLPLLTVVIGLVDGFNPCAMWVLLLLISLLLTVGSRKKMWLIGGIFILASGILYFIFMTAWLNLFLFLGYIKFIRIAIGLVALGAGVWRVKDFFTWKPGVCKVGDAEKHGKIENKIKKIIAPAALPATLLGIILLAFSVNLVEFVCSAGFPAVFTQVLAIQNVSAWQRYFYILVYDIFFMLDDLVVFSLAITTMRRVGFTDKYSRWSALLGGALLLLLGLALVFKPEILAFG